MRRVRKIAIITTIVLLSVVVLTILFISPLTKYLVEKYDEEYTGRRMEMDWAYVNPFTGYVRFSNFRMYESEEHTTLMPADTVFFSTESVGVNFSLMKLFSKTYEIRSLTLNGPKAWVIQGKDKRDFNFTDLIERFTAEPRDTTKAPVHFNLLDVEVNDGEFHYRDDSIPVNYYIKNVSFESEGMRWDVDTVAGEFSCAAGIGSGEIKGDFMYNLDKKDFRLNSVVRKLDMTLIEQYMRDFSNYGTVRATFDIDVNAKGNLTDAKVLDATGKLVINDFHFGKDPKEDYASFQRFVLDLVRVSPHNKIYHYDSVLLVGPKFKYKKYDHLDNIQLIFGKNGSKVKEAYADTSQFNLVFEIADYVEQVAVNFFRSEYKVNVLEVSKGNFSFEDYSLSEKFELAATGFRLKADSVDKKRKRAGISVSSGIDPYGAFKLDLSVNPRDTSDFDMSYKIERLPLPLFNPYFVTYTSYPMDRGTFELHGQWKVRNGKIQSDNHLVVIDPRLARRIKKKDAKWIPVPLIMAFVRERANVVDYEVPITGDLNDPKFHVRDVVFDVLKNIFIKPPTIPYGIKVREAEQKIEKILTFRWDFRQSDLRVGQERFLDRMAEFLEDNPQAAIEVQPVQYTEKEREHILLFEARKKYYLTQRKMKLADFSKEDSLNVVKMSIKEKDFLKFLDSRGGSGEETVQGKCRKIVTGAMITKRLERLARARETNFVARFKENGTEKQVKLKPPKAAVPANGYSTFKIEYAGDLPKELREAYEDLNKLDEEFPRRKYFRERKRLRDLQASK